LKGWYHTFKRLDAIKKTDNNNIAAMVQLNALARASVVNHLCIAVPNNVHPDADEKPTNKNTLAITVDEKTGLAGSANWLEMLIAIIQPLGFIH